MRSTVAPIVSHRGASGNAPENTLSAFKLAAEQGAEWVEFDVKITADKTAIILHDDTLERTTNGRGHVSMMSYEEIKAVDAGRWLSKLFAGEHIPTLSQTFDLMRSYGLSANIELKPCKGFEAETAEVVSEILDHERQTFPGDLVVSSFNDESLSAFKAASPDIPLGLLFGKIPWNWYLRAEHIGVDAIHCSHKGLTHVQVNTLRSAGYPVRCYTVNRWHTAKRLFDWGVESVITDFPSRLLRHL